MAPLENARAVLRALDPELLTQLIPDERPTYYDGRQTRVSDGPISPDHLATSLHVIVQLKDAPVPGTKLSMVERSMAALAGGGPIRSRDDLFGRLSAAPSAEPPTEPALSQLGGTPRLPADFEWPNAEQFVAQMDLADLAQTYVIDALPAAGTLSFFLDPTGGGTVHHHAGPADELVATEGPSIADGRRLEFEPRGILYVHTADADAYRYPAVDALPDEVRTDVEGALGHPLTASDPGLRMLGRPILWQGEDEAGSGHSFLPEEPTLLLLQLEHDDLSIQFWITEAHARSGRFDRAWVSASGS